jgi:2-polyprenyl-3-methyl-5-hydroxy-6-metoxy-1,4-benzoquinol methylase
MFLPDLSHRRAAPELMDAPDLEPERHATALRALARVNVLSLTAERVWKRVTGLAGEGRMPVRVLDLACGGGDVAVAVAHRARRSGLPVEVHACDMSSVALGQARERADRRGVSVRFFQFDVLEAPIPKGFDLVCSSLFLHHLTEDQGEAVLRNMAEAGRSLLVQDLVRSRIGYALAVATLRAITRSEVARIDGERSVRAAFTVPEVREMARRAGLAGARVNRCWPQRLELVWSATSVRGR